MEKTFKRWFSRVKRLRPARFLPALLAAVVCMGCFGLVWSQYLREAPEKAKGVQMNPIWDSATAPLAEGEAVEQVFVTEGPLYAVGLVFQRQSEAAGTVQVLLEDAETGARVMERNGDITRILYDNFTGFALDTPVTDDDARHTWRLTVRAAYTAAPGTLLLATSGGAPAGFLSLTQNGAALPGALALLVTVDQLGTLPLRAYWCLGAVCSLFLAALAGVFACAKPPKALVTFVVVLAMGLCYQFVTPAYSAPDEVIHYHTAYALSNRWMDISPTTEGANFTQRRCDTQPAFSDLRTTAFTYRYLLQHWADRAPADETYVDSREEILTGYQLPYVPAAVVITLARLAGLGGVATVCLARLMDLLLFSGAAAAAVWLAPKAGALFTLFALLPGVLHQGGSLSYDSMLLGVSVILTAACLHGAAREKPLTHWQIVGLGALCFLLAPLKAAYFPLCGLVLLIPGRCFASRRQRVLCCAGWLAAGAGHFLWYYRELLLRLLVPAASAPASAAEEVWSIFGLLSHPGIFLRLLCNTVLPNGDDYLAGILGGRLGYWNLASIELNSFLVAGFVLVLAAATLRRRGERFFEGPLARWLPAAVTLCVLALVTAACIRWTPRSYDYIWGFQGRYLSPVLPCFLMAVYPAGIRAEKDLFHPLVFWGAALEVLCLLNAMQIVFSR